MFVKAAHKNIFIDIGNTNIKILINTKIVIYSVKKYLFLIKKLIKENYFLYILNTNQIINKKLLYLSNKYKKQIFLLEKKHILPYVKINSNIDIDEIGIDILINLYYFMYHNVNDYIFINNGTYIYSLVVLNNVLTHINLFSGFDLQINNLLTNKIMINKKSKYKINTYSIIYDSIWKYIFNLFIYYKNKYKFINRFYLQSKNYKNKTLIKNYIIIINEITLLGVKFFIEKEIYGFKTWH